MFKRPGRSVNQTKGKPIYTISKTFSPFMSEVRSRWLMFLTVWLMTRYLNLYKMFSQRNLIETWQLPHRINGAIKSAAYEQNYISVLKYQNN